MHPRIHLLRAVPAGMARSLDGRIDKVPHGTITFDSLREYVVGDELRRVHWRSSAKVGELMVREQLDTSEPSIVVLLDDRAGAHPAVADGTAETFEAACEAAASVVAAAVREDLPVGLHLVSGIVGGSFLDVLTEAELRTAPAGDGIDPLTGCLRRLRQQRLGDTLIFLTGPGGRADLGAVSALRSAYPVQVVGLFGAGDEAPVSAGDRPDRHRRGGRRTVRRRLGRGARVVTVVRVLRAAAVPLTLMLLISLAGVVAGRIYAGPLLAQLVAGAAIGVGRGRRRGPAPAVVDGGAAVGAAARRVRGGGVAARRRPGRARPARWRRSSPTP